MILDRLVIREDNRSRLVEAIETAFREGEGLCRVEVIDQGLRTYSTDFRCQQCGRTFEPIRPVLFSFNHPLGACPECKGFGNILRYDPDLVIPDHSKSLAQGAIEPWSKPSGDWWQKQMLLSMKRRGVDLTDPLQGPAAEYPADALAGRRQDGGRTTIFRILGREALQVACARDAQPLPDAGPLPEL